MIKIRYRDTGEFSPGLHAEAERHGRRTVVYLLPGLTVQERRAALRRLRLSARMGHAPALPAAKLALALIGDGVRTSIGRAGAVFRSHPAGSTVPVMVVSAGAIAFLMLSTVSIRVMPGPRPAAQAAVPVVSANAMPASWPPQGRVAARPRDPGNRVQSGSDGRQAARDQPASGGPLSTMLSRPGPGGASTGGASTGGTRTAAGTTLDGGSDPAPGPTSTGPAGTGPAGTVPAGMEAAALWMPATAAAKGSPSAVGSGGGICVNVGSLRICLNV